MSTDELIPGLPEEISLECLTRLHYSSHLFSSGVCSRWSHLIKSRDFYTQRKQTGRTHKAVCLVQAIPVQPVEKPPRFGVTVYDLLSQRWERVEPIPMFPDGLPMFCQMVSSRGKLVVLGGWHPKTYDALTKVFVYDFATRRWRVGRDMPGVARTFFAAGEIMDGRVVIAGGHDVHKNALRSAWMYDVDEDEWSELPPMSQERDECEGVTVRKGSKLEFWVVSGFKTESQGQFEASAEWFDGESGQWKRVEDAWKSGQCPKACVGVQKGDDGKTKLVWFGELDSSLGAATCGIHTGENTVLAWRPYQGEPYGGFYKKQGQNGEFEKIDTPPEFLGLNVQISCVADI